MGHLPDERYLAAVALGAMFFSILYNGVNFLRMGTTGLAAQAYGRGDELGLNQLLLRGLISAAAIGLMFVLLQNQLADLFFMFMEAEQNVTSLTAQYFTIRIWGAPFASNELCRFRLVAWYGPGKRSSLYSPLYEYQQHPA